MTTEHWPEVFTRSVCVGVPSLSRSMTRLERTEASADERMPGAHQRAAFRARRASRSAPGFPTACPCASFVATA